MTVLALRKIRVSFRVCPVPPVPTLTVFDQQHTLPSPASSAPTAHPFAGFEIPPIFFRIYNAYDGISLTIDADSPIGDQLAVLEEYVERTFPNVAGAEEPPCGGTDKAFRISDPSVGRAGEHAPLRTDNKPGQHTWIGSATSINTVAYELRTRPCTDNVVNDKSSTEPYLLSYNIAPEGESPSHVRARLWIEFKLSVN